MRSRALPLTCGFIIVPIAERERERVGYMTNTEPIHYKDSTEMKTSYQEGGQELVKISSIRLRISGSGKVHDQFIDYIEGKLEQL